MTKENETNETETVEETGATPVQPERDTGTQTEIDTIPKSAFLRQKAEAKELKEKLAAFEAAEEQRRKDQLTAEQAAKEEAEAAKKAAADAKDELEKIQFEHSAYKAAEQAGFINPEDAVSFISPSVGDIDAAINELAESRSYLIRAEGETKPKVPKLGPNSDTSSDQPAKQLSDATEEDIAKAIQKALASQS